MVSRSYLYVPADRPDRLARAFDRGADALIVDLEDAVPPANKLSARTFLVKWLNSVRAPVWVRVNPGELGKQDVAALAASPNIAGFCLAKTSSAAQVSEISDLLDAVGSTALLAPLLEDAAAVLDARSIASAPRVARLQLGEADLRAQLGLGRSVEEYELLPIRSHLVLVSAAAGIDPPLGPASTNFADLTALAESTAALRMLGFFGRTCIHPAQIPVVNRGFTPTEAEVHQARSVLAHLADAQGSATSDTAGTMIDEAVARAARRVIERADASRLSTK